MQAMPQWTEAASTAYAIQEEVLDGWMADAAVTDDLPVSQCEPFVAAALERAGEARRPLIQFVYHPTLAGWVDDVDDVNVVYLGAGGLSRSTVLHELAHLAHRAGTHGFVG